MSPSSLRLCVLLCVGLASVEASKLSKDFAPNGAQPFSIGVSANPLAKVIDMLRKISDQVQEEHKDEKVVYDNFACFCKDKTERLTVHVKHHSREIDEASADIADWNAQSDELRTDRQKRLEDHEEFSASLKDNTASLKKENFNWENTESTFQNDKHLINQALSSLKGSKASVSSAAFLQMPGMSKLKNQIEIAVTMGLITVPKHKATAASFLQGGTVENPLESYEYHTGSDDIIDLVEDIKGKMQDLHNERQDEHVKAVASYKGMIDSLRKKIRANTNSISEIQLSQAKLKTDIAASRQVLIENNQDLKDTEFVLKRVTSACESRAREYDKRTAARRNELTALNAALACLTNAHAHAKSQEEALLQSAPTSGTKALPKPNHTDIADTKAKASPVSKEARTKTLSFLQEIQAHSDKSPSLRGNAKLSPDELKRKALDVISSEGRRVQSLMLMSLVATSANDPFKKVKQLLHDLRWRLEKEEHAEVSKQVWCTAEVEKAEHSRDLQFEVAKTLSREVYRLEALIDKLTASVKYYSDKAIDIGNSITKIYTDVAQLSEEQIKTMNVQKKARDEIRMAIQILKSYYTEAAKEALREDSFLQAEPDPNKILKDYRQERREIHAENERRKEGHDERTKEQKEKDRRKIGDLLGGAPSLQRSGSLGDAVALMESIADDFDREIGNIQGDLDKEHQELVEINKVLRSEKMKAEELRDLEMYDLKSTIVKRKTKFDDMQTAVDLLDSSLKELETLKPTCIDTGMSYSERVKQREVEMKALVKALCILGETDEKFNCPNDNELQ